MKATDDPLLFFANPDLKLDSKPIGLLRAVGRNRGGIFESPVVLSDDSWLGQSKVAGICSFGIFNPFGSTVWARSPCQSGGSEVFYSWPAFTEIYRRPGHWES